MPRRKKKKLTERLSAWKEEQKTEKQPSQQDDKQAEVESVQGVESGVQEPAEMLMEVEVSGEEPVDDQDVQETGAWDSERGFIFDPFTREDQLNVASMVNRSWFDGGLTMCQYLNRRDERGKRPGDLGAWASQEEESTEVSPVTSSKRKTTLNDNVEDRKKAKRERERKRYQDDEKYAQAQRDRKKTRYHTDEQFAQEKRDKTKERYHTDEEHAQEKRDKTKERYHTDEEHAQAERDRKKERYHTDEEHAQAERDRKKERYHTDEEHAQAERDRKKERYHTVEEHAQAERDRKKERYHTDEEHAQEKRDKTKERYHTDEEHAQAERDRKKERYHTDEEHAQEKRDYEKERYHTDSEQRDLKKRGQKGVIGPVVCVPADVSETHAVLPRMPTEAELIKVKLKRKLQYSGHYMYRQISPMKVDAALKYLVENNELYSGTSINADWALSWNEEGLLEPGGEGDSEVPTVPEHGESVSEDSDGVEGPTGDGMEDDEMDNILQQMNIEEAIEEADLAEDEELDNLLRGLPHDTCLQPIDIGQEFLDHHDEHILCVAPGQGEKPVSVFKEVGGEAMSFPVQFPTGKFSFNDDRNVSITPSKYFKARLMGADTREDLQNILKSDQGYRFLQPVRGTPQFWDRALNELFAMIRQLGIPTWFATFSAADLRWPEVLEAIRQDQSSVPVSDLSWEERCDILKSNPVTAARMFDHRVKLFFKHLIQSPSQPIGEVVDTFTRTEFQQRGSPHIHCLFWVKDAPKLDVNSEEEICSFVDRYVSCQLPNAETDKELFDIVSQVQMHRKGNTASCKKGGKVCRFGFPKPPVKQTFLCGPTPLTEMTFEELASIPAREAQAEAILKAFWDVLNKKSEPEKCSTDDLLKEVKITTAQFCVAMNTMANRKQIMLRREPKDMWVNNYNPHLLRAWNANMDIQYVLDAYSCVKYIVSYISKAEREMGKLLKQAQKEAREGNEDVVTEMRKVGHAYIHHRESLPLSIVSFHARASKIHIVASSHLEEKRSMR
ncbi:hypothetical protein Bbelb_255800 [Branchiostoma belcheri]|nr:hypothetical protein Bbelb_255800 [Branchiostoma belcheri]